jgi:aminopeptidase N
MGQHEAKNDKLQLIKEGKAMELNNLKTGLWGFKKQDVCEYIAKMSEELTAKMEQERRQNEEKLDAIVQAMRREGCDKDREIAALKEQVQALREENAALQKADKAWGALHDVAVLLTDCAKALLPLAGELAVKAVRQLRQRRA